jgi:hypothetical protein
MPYGPGKPPAYWSGFDSEKMGVVRETSCTGKIGLVVSNAQMLKVIEEGFAE